MSLTLIKDVAAEARRLAIAGSKLAPGDFRLKKLIAPLEEAGAKAPVFAKVAAAASAVVEADPKSAAGALLRLTTLTNAIAYTQGATGCEGALEPVEHSDLNFSTSQVSYRVLAPLIEALTTVGSGRWEVVSAAHERGQLADFRLLGPAIRALGDKYAELADLVAEEVLPQFGRAILPAIEKDFDPKGGKPHVRRLQVMARLAPEKIRDLCRELVTDGSKEMKVAAIEGLAGSEEDIPQLVELTKARAKDVRRAAYRALAQSPGEQAAATVRAALKDKELDVCVDAMTTSCDDSLVDAIITEGEATLAVVVNGSEKEAANAVSRLLNLILGLAGRSGSKVQKFVQRCLASHQAITKADTNAFQITLTSITTRVLKDGDDSSHAMLLAIAPELTDAPCQDALEAAAKSLSAKEFFDRFAPVVKKKSSAFAKEILYFISGGDADDWANLGDWADRRPPWEFDDRWLDLMIKLDYPPGVLKLARPGHKKCAGYVLKLTAKKGASDASRAQAQRVLFSIDHPDAIRSFEKLAAKTSAPYYLADTVRAAPEKLWSKLESIAVGGKFGNYYEDEIRKILAEARARKGQTKK